MKPPFSYGCPMVFLWFYYGFTMEFVKKSWPPQVSRLAGPRYQVTGALRATLLGGRVEASGILRLLWPRD